MTSSIPVKGDIVFFDDKQAEKKTALVVTTQAFNQLAGFALWCPISSQIKGYPYEVVVTGTQKTKGVILIDQVESFDWKEQKITVVDSVSEDCLKEATRLLNAMINNGG